MRHTVPALLLSTATALALPAAAAADPGTYSRCPAPAGVRLVAVARVACAEVDDAVAAAASASPAPALKAVGWTALRAATAPGGGAYDLVALRGRGVLRIRHAGATPDLDGPAAGRELVFAAGRIVGGKPIPAGSAFCTSGFLIRLGGLTGVLSAAHCAGLKAGGRTELPNVALRRRPQPGIVLGRVFRTLLRREPLDALVFPPGHGTGRTAVPVIDRGIRRPPWVVAGPARPLAGRRICFSGRTSGIDHCGIIRGLRGVDLLLSLQSGRIVECTTIRAAPGDSGGPVYTAPRRDGTVRAIGLVTLGVGRSGIMCFTPLGPVLDRLQARLVVG